MARNITLDTNSGFRAVVVFKMDESKELVYHYEGIYDKPGTANQRVSFWTNAGAKLFHDGPEWAKTNIRRGTFYDGWVEQAEITWDKVKD
jgi:hypothetical protein